MDKALGLPPLLLIREACAAFSADTSCGAAGGRGLTLCSETDCGQDCPTSRRACKADTEINTSSAELGACCCLYLPFFFFSFPPSLLFRVFMVSRHVVPGVAGSGLETAIPNAPPGLWRSSLTPFCHSASALKLVNKPCSEKYFC